MEPHKRIWRRIWRWNPKIEFRWNPFRQVEEDLEDDEAFDSEASDGQATNSDAVAARRRGGRSWTAFHGGWKTMA